MENRKGSGIFLGVIGVATLLVAIIGATFAYFSASAISNNDAVRVQSTVLTLGYAEDTSGLKTDLIPTKKDYALYAGTDVDWINQNEIQYTDEDGQTQTMNGKGECLDDYQNEICGVYKFTIGNPNYRTLMNITGRIVVTTNEFQNLWFAIYDESNTQVVAPTEFPETNGEVVLLPELNQRLLGSSLDEENADFNEEDPTTYTPLVDKSDPANAGAETNVRTYTMVIWIEELNANQTEQDSGKIFTAGISFDTGDGKGVTGIIAAADSN